MAEKVLLESNQLYKRNKFNECCDNFSKLLPHFRKSTEDLHHVLECIVTNNLNVCAALAEVVKNSLNSTWESKLEGFIAHFNNWRSFHILPQQLRITLGYNALFWSWIMPKPLELKDKYYYLILDIAEDCLKEVLEELKVSMIEHTEFVEREDSIIWLMESVSNRIPKLPKMTAIAVIKLLNISYLIFLRKNKSNLVFRQPVQSIENEIQGIRLLETSMKNERKNKVSTVTSSKSGYYTFGFGNLNSILGDTAEADINSLFLTCIFKLVSANEMEKAVEILRDCDAHDNFTALVLYVKAYCLFQLGHIYEAFLTLSSMQDLPLSDCLKFYFHILLGKYYSEKKMLEEAETEFMSAKNVSLFLAPEALYHLFKTCEKDNLLMRRRFLDDIYQCIKKIGGKDGYWKMSEIFEWNLLSMLHVTPAISEAEVIYLLAKLNLEHKKFLVAETFYLKLLEILKTSCDLVNCDLTRQLAPLPKFHIIYHETVKSSIERENFTVALENCQSCLNEFIPSCSVDFPPTSISYSRIRIKYYDEYLNSLNEDCISLILMSQIYFQMNEDVKAMDSIERCINVVMRHINKKDNKSATLNASNSEEITFFKCFLAKLFLCKAVLLNNMGKNPEEVLPFYKKALSFNDGDSDVLHYYTDLLTSQGKNDEAANLRETQRFDLDINRCFSEALKSFMKVHSSELDSAEDMEADLFEDSATKKRMGRNKKSCV